MQQILLQIIITLLGFFALSRAYLRFKERKISSISFIFWFGLWILGVYAVLDPSFTTLVANFLGIGRGVDAVIYASIGTIFYLIFRIYIKIEDTERHLTELTKKIALSNISQRKKPASKRKPK